MKTANFSKVVIIQSLNQDFTGNRLRDDLGVLAVFTEGIVTIELVDVKTKKQFFNLLYQIRQDVHEGQYEPIIHIEAHGNTDYSGLSLASNESISWKEMKLPLSEINIATGLNLMLCISACYGGSFVSSINTNDRAPCWGLVGPKKEMYPQELLKAFTCFYEEIFKTRNGGQAIRRLNDGLFGDDAKFYFTTAEQFFELIWIHYLQTQCTNEKLNKRANYIVREHRKKKSIRIPSRNEIKGDIIKQHPKHFEKSKTNFFMMDLFDKNKDRFTVDFETALRKSREAQSGSRGFFSPGPHNTQHAGPHWAFH